MKKVLIFTLILCTFFSTLIFPRVNAATHNIPSVDSVWDSEKYPYAVVMTNSSGEYWFSCSSTPVSTISENGDLASSGSGTNQTYKLSNSNTWVYQNANVSTFGRVDYLVYTSHTLMVFGMEYAATPDFFYPPLPLHQIVGEVGVTSVKSLWSLIVGGTIPILTACGVGCLALLIVLKLFGKKSLIFRR